VSDARSVRAFLATVECNPVRSRDREGPGRGREGIGFRSAYLIQYASKLDAATRSGHGRRPSSLWSTYFASDLRPSRQDVGQAMQSGQAMHLEQGRFGPGSERLRALIETWDLLEVTAIPISHDGELVGVAGFCGAPQMDRPKGNGTHTSVVCCLHLPALRITIRDGGPYLTAREREVMSLAARGLTSEPMAEQLGMSPRTANQHIDNVADKLGTRNRHTRLPT